MTITSTVTLIEIIWTVPAVVGLILTAWMVVDIWGDRRALRRLRWNGLARLQVDHWLRGEVLVLAIHTVLTLVGVYALTRPAAATSAPPSPLAWVITAALVSVPAMLMVRSLGDRYMRHKLRQDWRR